LFHKISSVSDIALRVIYRSIYHFVDHLKVINMISDSLEEKINSSMENRYLINLFTLEKSLVYYLNAISGNGVVFERLKLNALRLGVVDDNAEMLDDVVIENNQCFKQAEIYSNILAGLMDARASIVSNNLNMLMKNLNVITIAIMVPTFVVSAFSMNVGLPFHLEQSPIAFWVIMGLALLSVFAYLGIWRFKKW
jgi:magnesium transporter